jgi:glycosidase
MSDNYAKIHSILEKLYDQAQAEWLFQAIQQRIKACKVPAISAPEQAQLTQNDILLITYADQFQQADQTPLRSLDAFLRSYLGDVINRVHILPFFPYSSDDGFSIIDYCQVAKELGDWQDIRRLEEHFQLTFDLVINHVSAKSAWFQKFLQGQPPYTGYFITPGPDSNLSEVVRPRSTPLLTPFETARGRQYVWTTFSADQIDLNYANPRVMLEMIEVLLTYVAQGAQIIRLDAIAYLWKTQGTSCIHLPETHLVIKLLRDILDMLAPQVLLLTETNVPHKENVSYFGAFVPEKQRTDEAQIVYQFPLPPLILHTFLSGDASRLSDWAEKLPSPMPGTTFLNFTASHDGIGVRPAEGLLAPGEVQALVETTQARGGLVSYRSNPDGSQIAYEVNITWYDALNDPAKPDQDLDIPRFLASQAIMLSLAGLPGIYIHSLLGSRNCKKCVNESGRPRSINREKFKQADIQEELNDPLTLRSRVLVGYRRMIQARKGQPAFHPAARQDLLRLGPAIFALIRTAQDGTKLICLTNVTQEKHQAKIMTSDGDLPGNTGWHDLLSGEIFPASRTLHIPLGAYQNRWLAAFANGSRMKNSH